ncbi:NAD(P)/FAD-dependent oxidoreductase [Cognatilysobacter segetis]|uniref:NAD(P)/FAD-dependent oxidoreductase n=2 Tax=Cognatilysobacter segetis TaxID=2492394 RepID=UPI00105F5ACF|nr:FAD-dependent oxidoreductase [Lysobacter segetis]
MSATRTASVAVVGAGIVGLSCAHALMQRGYDCTVVDARGPGEATSFGNAGSISVGNVLPQSTPGILRKGLRMLADPLSPLKLDWPRWPHYARWLVDFVRNGRAEAVAPIIDALHALNAAARDAWIDLAADIGADDLLAHTGYLHVYSEDASFAAGAWERALMQERRVRFDVLDGAELRSLEPGIGAGFRHAVFQRDALAMRDPGRFCTRLADALVARGMRSVVANVSAIEPTAGGYVLRGDTGDLRADKVVIAGGVWSNRLLAPFGRRVPVVPARGYHLMYPPQEAPVVGRPTLWAERYMVVSPMRAGIRMTSIKELTALDTAPRFGLIHRLDGEARKLFPALAAAPASEWAGLRPCTPDSLPVIDRVGDAEVWLATGHGHLGLTQAPITGRLVAESMSGVPTSLPLAPYRIDRFR